MGGAGGAAAALGNAGMAELLAEGAPMTATGARARDVTGVRAGDAMGVVAGDVMMPKGLQGWVVAQVMSSARQIAVSCACLLCACTQATVKSAMPQLGGCCFARAGWLGRLGGRSPAPEDGRAGEQQARAWLVQAARCRSEQRGAPPSAHERRVQEDAPGKEEAAGCWRGRWRTKQ